jgi:hypothetical protein
MERIAGRAGGSFVVIPDSKREMAPRLDFGMNFGVEI